jgi:anhydro-N-acetylmuramic acid kinase
MQQLPYDVDGAWAAQGLCIDALLTFLLNEPYLALPPPKSTGRDLFHPAWLAEKLKQFPSAAPADIQATLAAFTATTIADAIAKHAPDAHAVYACGGGAFNAYLMQQLATALQARGLAASVQSTAALGVSPNHVEALAFAWLADRHVERESGNIPGVTGAKGPRILGALYPA